MESINCKIVSWTEIENWTKNVATKIRESGYKPETCIGLTRGGWIPSRLICDILRIKDLHAVKTEHWGITATKDGSAKLVAPLNVDIKDKSVLLVDDITDTGQSLSLAVDHAKAKDAKNVMSATLLHITHSKITPDFYAVEVPADDWAWFIFPWNFNEDIQSLINKALSDGEKADKEIRDVLRKHCKIMVNQHIINTTLLELARMDEVEKKGDKWLKKND